jgi:dolichol-phosphate mannosyltransferase
MAEKILDELVSQLTGALSSITTAYEIILVNDRSPDNSWEGIQKQAARDNKVKGIQLSRNFGQHYAITAGLDHARGNWVVVMDCDLQDQPSEIVKLYNKAREGYDVVLARRAQRQDGFFKKLFSRMFWGLLSYLTGTRIDHTVVSFGIYKHKVIEAVCTLRESIRYFPTMITWVGFKTTAVDVQHGRRHSGESSYNFSRMLRLALDISLAYSDKPIRIFIQMGFAISFLAFCIGLYYLVLSLTGEIVVLGFTTIIISIWFLGGLTIMILGILGLYIGKTFEGVKNRPIYVVDEKINID